MRLTWVTGVASWWVSTPLGEVIPHMAFLYRTMACTITPCTRGWVKHLSSRRLRLCTHSPKMSQINTKLLKWWLKTRNALSMATYLMRALRNTTAVTRCVGQIYQCITPLGTSSPGQGIGWMNPCAKMALRIPSTRMVCYKIRLSISSTLDICPRLLESKSKKTKRF